MRIFLSGGPILEPMIGMFCATLSCIGILIYIIYKYFKSEHYQQAKLWDISKKMLYAVVALAIILTALFFIWYLLFFIFTGIAFSAIK